MKCIKIGNSVYVNGVKQDDVLSFDETSGVWLSSIVNGKKYIFEVKNILPRKDGKRFLIEVGNSNIPKKELFDEKYICSDSLLSNNMVMATEEEVKEFKELKNVEVQFNCIFRDLNDSSSTSFKFNLTEENSDKFFKDIKDLVVKYNK